MKAIRTHDPAAGIGPEPGPEAGAVYSLARAAEAFRAKAAGGIPGRIILQP
jgi:hypothetical protein